MLASSWPSWSSWSSWTSGLLQLDQERLVLRRPGVGVHGERGQHVGERPGVVLGAGEAPVDREPDLPDLLAVDLERREPLGHHRDAADLAARRAHHHLAAVKDAL